MAIELGLLIPFPIPPTTWKINENTIIVIVLFVNSSIPRPIRLIIYNRQNNYNNLYTYHKQCPNEAAVDSSGF